MPETRVTASGCSGRVGRGDRWRPARLSCYAAQVQWTRALCSLGNSARGLVQCCTPLTPAPQAAGMGVSLRPSSSRPGSSGSPLPLLEIEELPAGRGKKRRSSGYSTSCSYVYLPLGPQPSRAPDPQGCHSALALSSGASFFSHLHLTGRSWP